MISQLRYACRQLRRTPTFTVTVVATLALCLGANLAIFAVLDAVVLRPLPFPASDRLVTIYKRYPLGGVDRAFNSILNYFERRNTVAAFEAVAAYEDASATVGAPGSPRRVQTARISPEFFSMLGVPLALGRTFADAELEQGADAVAVLTDAFWRTEFAGDANVLGRKFHCDGLAVTVIGVLPPGFQFLSSQAQVFRPLACTPADRAAGQRHSNACQLYARLAPNATLADAQAQIDALDLQEGAGNEMLKRLGFHSVVTPLHDDHVASVRPILASLQGGCVLLLLLGLTNLANLLLIRAGVRRKEIAIRQALGAGRWQIAIPMVTETLVLAIGGGVLGIGVGWAGIAALREIGMDQLPQSRPIALDSTMVGGALLGTAVVGLILALPGVWHSLWGDQRQGLNETRGSTAGPAAQSMRYALVVVQIALAFLLVSSAGVLGLSLKRLLATPLGFASEQVVTGQITLSDKSYHDAALRVGFTERLLAELQALPGIAAAAIHTGMPFGNDANDTGVTPEGYDPKDHGALRAHYLGGTQGDYWRTLRIPLLQGRTLDDGDIRSDSKVCVVDQAVADRYWPGRTAVGRRLCIGVEFHEEQAFTVVGVVAAVKQLDPAEAAGHGAVYFPYSQFSLPTFSVALRASLSTTAVRAILSKAVARVDPAIPLDRLDTLDAKVNRTLVTRRSSAVLAATFAGAALLLAAVGTYGVLGYVVSQRRREIAVRMALGALPGNIIAHFLRLGCRLLLVGTLLGIIGASGAGRIIQVVLYGVAPVHAGVLAATVVLLASLVLGAMIPPVFRAARTRPNEVLRSE